MDLVQNVILNSTINDDQIREIATKSNNKFRKNGKYTDAAIRTRDGKLFSMHRNIMSANSSYFAAIFDKNDNNFNQIYDLVSNISEEYLDKIIDYIYTGIFNVKFENILTFDKYANEFQLRDLESIITNFLIKNINEVTCLEYWRHSVKLLRFALEKECLTFIENNTESFLMTSICDLRFNELLVISSNKNLCCTHELLYLTISAWIKIDFDNRKKYIQIFFKNIELSCLSTDFIKSYILTDKILISNTEIITKINNFSKEKRKNYSDDEQLLNRLIGQQKHRPEDEIKPILTEEEENYISMEWNKFCLNTEMMKKLPPIDCSNMIKYCELSLKSYNKLVSIKDIIQRKFKNENTFLESDRKKLIPSSELSKSNDEILMLSKNWICKYNFTGNERILKIEPRQRYSTCSFNQNSVFISGGINTNSCEYYSDSTRLIKKMSSMIENRMWHSNIELNNTIYSLGGYWNGGSFEMYDLNVDKWLKNDSKMNKKEFDFGVVNNGGSLFTFGGLTRNRGYSETVERYDPREGMWKNLAEESKKLLTVKSICINDLVYCFGETNSAIFDIRKNRWRIKSFSYPINIELQWLHFDVLNFNKTIYVLGNNNYEKSFMYTFDYKDELSWLEVNLDFFDFEGYEYHLSKLSSND